MDLKSIIRNADDVPIAEVEYIGGFKVSVKYVHRSAFSALAEKHRKLAWNTVTHAREETVDSDKVNAEFIKKYVVGWSGLTPEILVKMIPVGDDVDFTEIQEVPFTFDNAHLLMTECADFESFIVASAVDISNFQTVNKEALRGN